MADRAFHDQLAGELASLAEFVRSSPQIAESLRYVFNRILVYTTDGDSARPLMASFARAAKASRVEVTKEFDGDGTYAGLNLWFGAHVSLHVYAPREQVCERVVVGTRRVTKQVPDPAAPIVEVTETVEDVEWRCVPLLAADRVHRDRSESGGAR